RSSCTRTRRAVRSARARSRSSAWTRFRSTPASRTPSPESSTLSGDDEVQDDARIAVILEVLHVSVPAGVLESSRASGDRNIEPVQAVHEPDAPLGLHLTAGPPDRDGTQIAIAPMPALSSEDARTVGEADDVSAAVHGSAEGEAVRGC